MRTVICFLAALCAIALSTPSTAHTVQEAIEEANSQFAQKFNKGDTATVASFYTADATVLPPGAEAVNGRDAVGAFWQSAIEGGMRDLTQHARPLPRLVGAFRYW